MTNWKYWGYLVLAALLEVAWSYCLKWMQFSDLKLIRISHLHRQENLKIWGPFAGYILFGIGNVYFFSLATKQIPLATAFAVWTGVSLVLLKISEIWIYRQKVMPAELLFMLMIMGGIAGLKYLNVKA